VSTTHAGAIAAKLQGAHRARTEREDTRMSKDESVWDDTGVRIDRALKELTEAIGAMAELRPGDGGDAAELARVTRERDELAAQAADLRRSLDIVSDAHAAAEERLEQVGHGLTEAAAHVDCWVPVPLRWATVVAGDVTVSTRGGENKLWGVAEGVHGMEPRVTVQRAGKERGLDVDPDATVPVLVRHTERDALVALREGGVNGSVVAREVK
jgi:hypothetical protein